MKAAPGVGCAKEERLAVVAAECHAAGGHPTTAAVPNTARVLEGVGPGAGTAVSGMGCEQPLEPLMVNQEKNEGVEAEAADLEEAFAAILGVSSPTRNFHHKSTNLSSKVNEYEPFIRSQVASHN